MSFPVSIFLIPYALFLAFFFLMSMIYAYHVLRYTAKNVGTYIFLLIYAGVSLIVISISFQAILGLDWGSQVTILS